MRNALALPLVAVGLVGCAARTAPPALPVDHPASVDATPATLPAMSTALSMSDPIPQPTADPNVMSHDMGSHAAHGSGAPAAATQAAAPATGNAYVCPMHPEVTSAEPSRCPKCKMKLVARPAVGGQGGGHEGH